MNVEILIQRFEQFNTNILEEYSSLISSQYNGEIFPPYIPHIGKQFKKYKIMMYGMAQNINQPWDSLTKMSRIKKVRQLYDEQSYKDLCIGPYKIMLSVTGIYLYAKHNVAIEYLGDIHDSISATNYYKFSLNKSGKDINPDRGLFVYANPDKYWEINDKLSMIELEFLQPSTIISFNGRHNNVITKAEYNLITINDPAWILRGGGGALRKYGSWYRETNNSTVLHLASSYINQINDYYSGKQDAVKFYLLKYFSDWQNN